ncbi:hypothetical protein PS918_03081 [Pseudomonas fluorescens]|uniref:Uncharacterized protein n=1 Tax=Pseudomonas fluorescens TaxID=294 RepID=A0A5E7SSJ5_PSEFL|nr:hypothetical protein [Pseudomonas fluorescens]VVP89376.1 hypothetical protein PS918_03081 [Pseudomonas fluorescens]
MIHYHGLPITPETAAAAAISGGHAFVSFSDPRQLALAAQVCQSFAIDNGAFSAWKQGKPITDWQPFYCWAADAKLIPACDFAVIPDVIDGDEKANDALLDEWPLPRWFGAPVWHMHESLDRLERLASAWPRVCIGSSGDYSQPGSPAWWVQMGKAMRVVCDDDGRPMCKLHGLRMLDPAIFGHLPLSSADSTNIGRNIGIDQAWRGTYSPPTKEARASVMRSRIESHNSPPRWTYSIPEIAPTQGALL